MPKSSPTTGTRTSTWTPRESKRFRGHRRGVVKITPARTEVLERMMQRNLTNTAKSPGENENKEEAEILRILQSKSRAGKEARKLANSVFQSMHVPVKGLSGASTAADDRDIGKTIAFCCIRDAVSNRPARSTRSGDDPQAGDFDIDPCNIVGTLYAPAEPGSDEEAEQMATFEELKKQEILRGLDEDEQSALVCKFRHVYNGTTRY